MFYEVLLSQLPEAGAMTGSELLYMEQNGNPVKVAPTQLGNIPTARTGTKAQLNALVTANSLVAGQFYKCTDATTADATIILLAIAPNKFAPQVENVADAENFYLYDFTNDEMRGKIGLETLLIGTDTPTGDPNFSKFEVQYNQIPGFGDVILYLDDQCAFVKTFGGSEPRFATVRARGTINTPLPVQSGDVIGGIHLNARNTSGASRGSFTLRTTATSAEEGGFFPAQTVFYGRKKGGSLASLGDEFMRVDEQLLLSIQGAFRSARLTTVQRDALVGLTGGEQIFNTDANEFQLYNGTTWVSLKAVQSVTYSALNTLVVSSGLTVGAKYLITDATTANIPLIVEAVAVNKIGTDAKSPDFPEDVIQYDFATGTRGTILWRWDTINDISVAQDLRNLQNLTIGTGGRSIHTSTNFFGSIGNNVVNVYIDPIPDALAVNSIPSDTSNLWIYAGATYNNTVASSNVIAYGHVNADGNVSRKTFMTDLNVVDSPGKTFIYANPNINGTILNTDGDAYMVYVSSGAWAFLNVAP